MQSLPELAILAEIRASRVQSSDFRCAETTSFVWCLQRCIRWASVSHELKLAELIALHDTCSRAATNRAPVAPLRTHHFCVALAVVAEAALIGFTST